MAQWIKQSPLSTTPSVVGSDLTWDNTLCDVQIVVLSLGGLCVRSLYVCTFPWILFYISYIPSAGIVFEKKKQSGQVEVNTVFTQQGIDLIISSELFTIIIHKYSLISDHIVHKLMLSIITNQSNSITNPL